MRLIAFAGVLLQLLGCASTPEASSPENGIGCTLESARYYPKLAGLIVMPKEEAWKLLAQIPVDARGNAFCWYQLRSGNLEARYGYDQYGYARGVFLLPKGAPNNGGYEFERREDGWHFVRLNEHILLERH